MSLSRYSWSLSAHAGCYIFDYDATITLYAVWSMAKFEAFQQDLAQQREEWRRNSQAHRIDALSISRECAIFGTLDDTFFPTRAKARTNLDQTTTRWTVQDYRVVRLRVLMFAGRMYIRDAKVAS